jgi:hypothetical protein
MGALLVAGLLLASLFSEAPPAESPNQTPPKATELPAESPQPLPAPAPVPVPTLEPLPADPPAIDCLQQATEAGFRACPQPDTCNLALRATCTEACRPGERMTLELRDQNSGEKAGSTRGVLRNLVLRRSNLPAGPYDLFVVSPDWPDGYFVEALDCPANQSRLLEIEIKLVGC